MSITDTFYELAIKNAEKQSVMIDALTEESPILASIPMEQTSDGITNVYEEVTVIDAAQVVDFDAPLTEINADTQIKQVQLSKFGGIMSVGEDKAKQMGGVGSYFAKKMPPILRDTGNKVETSLIYNSFRATALANGKLLDIGGTGSVNYSIIIVKWSPGETTGLFDPSGMGNGKMFDILPLHGGNASILTDGMVGYQQRISTYFGIQLANSRYVAGAANIDPAVAEDAAMITEAQMDSLITDVRGNPANTVFYMHPSMLNLLYRYKSSKLQMVPDSRNLDRQINAWNGIPIMTSYNFLDGTEPQVIIP